MAIGKDDVPEMTANQVGGFDGSLFVYELHGQAHPALSKLNADMKQAIAAHHLA